MRHLFILNPAAGKRDCSEAVMAQARRYFLYREETPEFYRTKAPGDAIRRVRAEALAAEAAGQELRVYACGGDGTLNECVNGAAGLQSCAVTHFPTGTGNDFLRTFGEERKRFRCLEEVIQGEVRPLDLISCNGRYSISVCSVGFDARVGTRVHRYSSTPILGARLGYVLSLGANFVDRISDPMEIRAGDTAFQGRVNLCCVCNGTCYGGGFTPVPEARPDDGVLDVLIAHDVTRPRFFGIVPDYALGRYARHPKYILHERTDRVLIQSPEELDINLDGELMKASTVEMTLAPGGVNFIFPKKMNYFRGR